MTEELLYLWFGMISRMTHTVKMNVAMKYGGIRGLWNTSEEQLRDELTQAQADGFLEHRDAGKVAAYAEELRRNDITYIYPGHKLYPGKLYDIPDPPMLLFAAGDVDVLADLDPAVAVVGARKASVYGREAADRLSGELAASGVTIVSGMALGIDGAAHRAAMKAGGKTVAVLGSGINVPYPRENYDIYHDIRNGGGVVLSECGLDIRPDAFRFPYRNRIISGLSSGVLVVEAREKSGSLITADQALEQGREVYAVPGAALSGQSLGCQELVRQGAKPVFAPEDVLEDLAGPLRDFGVQADHLTREAAERRRRAEAEGTGLSRTLFACMPPETDTPPKADPGNGEERPTQGAGDTDTAAPSPAQDTIIPLLREQGPLHVDALGAALGRSPAELAPVLLGLEIMGRIRRLPGARYEAV